MALAADQAPAVRALVRGTQEQDPEAEATDPARTGRKVLRRQATDLANLEVAKVADPVGFSAEHPTLAGRHWAQRATPKRARPALARVALEEMVGRGPHRRARSRVTLEHRPATGLGPAPADGRRKAPPNAMGRRRRRGEIRHKVKDPEADKADKDHNLRPGLRTHRLTVS